MALLVVRPNNDIDRFEGCSFELSASGALGVVNLVGKRIAAYSNSGWLRVLDDSAAIKRGREPHLSNDMPF